MYKENMKINYCKIVQNEFVSSFIWDWKLDLVLDLRVYELQPELKF